MSGDVWHTLHLPRPAFASVCGAISIEHQIVDFRRLCEWKVRIAHRTTVGNSLSLRLNNGLMLRTASTILSTNHATSATPQVPALHDTCCPYSLATYVLPLLVAHNTRKVRLEVATPTAPLPAPA